MSGGSAPANTTSTTTVNQSPWQNATYRALALGTPGNLGPVAQQLKIGQQLTNDWMDIQSGRNPGLYYGLPNATPQELAMAKAGQDVGFAAGRAPAPTAPTPTPTATPTATAAQGGIMSLQNFASGGLAKAAVNPQAYAPGGKVTPKYNAKSSADDKLTALQEAEKAGYKPKPAEVKFMQSMADTTSVRQQLGDTPYTVDAKTGALKPVGRGSGQSSAEYTTYLNKFGTAGASIDPKLAKQYGAQTAAQVKQTAADKATAANRPYSYSDLATPTAFLDPKTGQNMLPDAQLAYQRARELGVPEQIGRATEAYKSGIAGLGEAAKYKAKDVDASQMAQYQQVAAQKADTERAAAAAMNRGDVREVNALMAQVEKYNAALMSAPADIQAQAYQAAQAQKNQMAGPQSWTDPGTAQKYMNPYQQAVTDQELFEANRQAQMRENQQRSQATQQKAFGGTRAALQESEGRRNLGYLLSDIQAKGSQQAYQSGMGQFSAEQGLGLQAGQANLSAAQQTDLANQAALNNQRSQYVTQALEAAKNNYGGQLTAAQQNQIADNAARQFNAAAQNTANNNFVAQQLQAQLANQQMDFGVGQMNTQNQQQANLANAASANQANQQYAQLNLQGQLANQQAGLTTEQQNAQLRQQANLANQQAGLQANQQNIGAYGAMGNMAQGLGGLGATQSQINLNNLAALGQSATAQTQYAQGALDRNTQNAMNWYNLPSTFNAAGINALNAQPVSGGTNTSQQTFGQAKWFAKGGKVEKWGPKK